MNKFAMLRDMISWCIEKPKQGACHERGSGFVCSVLFTFKRRTARQASVRVSLVNTRGERFEAMHDIRWG